MECNELLEKVEGRNVLIELGGTRNAKNPSAYRVINTDDIPIIRYFDRALHDFEQTKNNYIFRRLSAERSIVPEKEMDLELSSTGEGASNLVRAF